MIESIRVHDTIQPNAELLFTAIDNLEDLALFMDAENKGLSQHVSQLIVDRVPPKKWDHCIGDHPSLALSVTDAYIKEDANPFSHLPNAIGMRRQVLTDCINKHGVVWVNKNGGCCSPTKTMTIVERSPLIKLSINDLYTIKPNTRFLNLENDPELEQYTVDWMQGNDPHFSYLTSMRYFSNKQLSAVFKEFCAAGGTSLFLYTTASDVVQMDRYLTLAKAAGIEHCLFHFNQGYTQSITDCLNKHINLMTLTHCAVGNLSHE
jgi:hypothetical protein